MDLHRTQHFLLAKSLAKLGIFVICPIRVFLRDEYRVQSLMMTIDIVHHFLFVISLAADFFSPLHFYRGINEGFGLLGLVLLHLDLSVDLVALFEGLFLFIWKKLAFFGGQKSVCLDLVLRPGLFGLQAGISFDTDLKMSTSILLD